MTAEQELREQIASVRADVSELTSAIKSEFGINRWGLNHKINIGTIVAAVIFVGGVVYAAGQLENALEDQHDDIVALGKQLDKAIAELKAADERHANIPMHSGQAIENGNTRERLARMEAAVEQNTTASAATTGAVNRLIEFLAKKEDR